MREVMDDSLRGRIDHLVYAAPRLDEAVALLERMLGVRAAPGGQHLGRGTRNALIGLGPACYLEIIGPDPEQREFEGPRWFGIDQLTRARLAAWAARASSIEVIWERARQQGVELGPIGEGSRQRPDGSWLRWQFTDPVVHAMDGVVPFLIDWGESRHPARDAPVGCTLVDFRAEHPDPPRARHALSVLELNLDVQRGSDAALIATIECPHGRVELR